jgi:hypothetical protein
MRSSFVHEFADWFHQTRNMLLFAALLIIGLFVGIWWFGADRSSPIRAAEAEVRAVMKAPDLPIRGTQLRHRSPPGIAPISTVLVCGVIDDDPGRRFAALVRERRRRSALSLIGSGDRVRILALPEAAPSTPDQMALLAECASI